MAWRTAIATVAATALVVGGCGELVAAKSDEPAPTTPGDAGEAGLGDRDAIADAGPSGEGAPSVGCDGVVECERVVFVTSALWTGAEIGGLGGADDKCTQRAAVATSPRVRGRTFRAWLSDPTRDARDHVDPGMGAYVTPTENEIARDHAALATGNHAHAIDLDENGVAVSGSVWTGTDPAGARTTDTCSDWARTAAFGTVGDPTAANELWTHGVTPQVCSFPARLYCVEH